MVQISATVGKRGTMVLPKDVRDRYGIREGDLLLVEERDDGLLLRPARLVPRDVEEYTPERRAEFMLNNAVRCTLLIALVGVPHEPPAAD